MSMWASMARRCCWAMAVPAAPTEAPMTPAGLPGQELWPQGREPWSMAFLRGAGTERLYSGVTKMTASAAASWDLNSTTAGDGEASSSWL